MTKCPRCGYGQIIGGSCLLCSFEPEMAREAVVSMELVANEMRNGETQRRRGVTENRPMVRRYQLALNLED